MAEAQEQYDDAMFAFSQGEYETAIAGLKGVLDAEPSHFDAQLALGMAYYRMGNYAVAIQEGLKAEKLRPQEQLVHTNLSLFFMKAGDKVAAEQHGLQARISSWKTAKPRGAETADLDLQMAPERPPAPAQFPAMPWKKKPGSA